MGCDRMLLLFCFVPQIMYWYFVCSNLCGRIDFFNTLSPNVVLTCQPYLLLFSVMACHLFSVPSHYLNHIWLIVKTIESQEIKFTFIVNWNEIIFVHDYAFRNTVPGTAMLVSGINVLSWNFCRFIFLLCFISQKSQACQHYQVDACRKPLLCLRLGHG